MRKVMKALAWAVAGLAVAAALLFVAAWYKTERALARTYRIDDPALLVLADAAALAHGRHLFHSRGCSDCHGERGQGRLVLDAPPLKLIAPNITPGGAGRFYDADGLARAVRHGVRHDGRSLVYMPSLDYAELSDADMAALAAYVRALPADGNDPGRIEVRPLGKLLYLAGKLPLISAEAMDHAPRARTAPPAAASVAYGGYIARTCISCHGGDFAGQPVPGTPPEFPPAANLTPAGLEDWTEADFVRVFREGRRPDGRALHPLMPWQAFSGMTDEELRALWLYFASLPPPPTKG